MSATTIEVDDTILYGMEGVCRVLGKTEKEFDGKRSEYYVLKPLYGKNSTIYAPVGSEKTAAKMRRVLSAEEIYALIRSVPDDQFTWIEDEAKRKAEYRQILSGGDRRELIGMVRTLYRYNQERKSQGKKLHVADERMMKDAERLLYDEFAHVLDIRPEQVLPLICEQPEISAKPAQ